jgi:tetratricopeptide (TPR) repeat protein
MPITEDTWDARVDALWAAFDDHEENAFLAEVRELTKELDADDPRGPFEQACAHDSTGHSDLAAPLYRKALVGGLTGIRRRRAVIQLASSLRNLGETQESLRLLEAELRQEPDELDDAVAGFLALALASAGREREGLSLVLVALARHLPRYNRSLANYGRELLETESV